MGFSLKVIKHVIDQLAPYVAALFNLCVDNGIFPEKMKDSKIVPLYKTGSKGNPSNYRPMSVLPCLSKIFEEILLNQLLVHFNTHKILHVHQYGW